MMNLKAILMLFYLLNVMISDGQTKSKIPFDEFLGNKVNEKEFYFSFYSILKTPLEYSHVHKDELIEVKLLVDVNGIVKYSFHTADSLYFNNISNALTNLVQAVNINADVPFVTIFNIVYYTIGCAKGESDQKPIVLNKEKNSLIIYRYCQNCKANFEAEQQKKYIYIDHTKGLENPIKKVISKNNNRIRLIKREK